MEDPNAMKYRIYHISDGNIFITDNLNKILNPDYTKNQYRLEFYDEKSQYGTGYTSDQYDVGTPVLAQIPVQLEMAAPAIPVKRMAPIIKKVEKISKNTFNIIMDKFDYKAQEYNKKRELLCTEYRINVEILKDRLLNEIKKLKKPTLEDFIGIK